ncbi:MAG: tyrosine-type recombinase/integrase [Oscillospiraceae bacterium]|nr:tyrosine-type recombinase/integrase [Oscillospiraceae bacterium]
MSTAQPIRNKRQVREMSEFYLERGELRNHLLIVMGVHTALRVSDLLRLTWDDVYDFNRERIHDSVAVTEKKTGKTKIVALNKVVAAGLRLCLSDAKRGGVLLESRKGSNKAISRVQAYRIIREAAENLGYASRVSCHSLRKTFGYHAWKNGVSPAVIMEIYNHSSFAVTRRYLGVSQDDKDAAYRKLAEVM